MLGREGAAVAVNYLKSEGAAEATAAEIRAAGGRALAVGADIGDYAAVQGMVERVKREWGSIDVLVNNAGLVHRKFFLQTKPEEWRAQIDVGLYGVLNCCHAVAAVMVERKARPHHQHRRRFGARRPGAARDHGRRPRRRSEPHANACARARALRQSR